MANGGKTRINKAAFAYGLIAYACAATTTLALLIGFVVGKEENKAPQLTRLECLRKERDLRKCPPTNLEEPPLR